MQSLQMQLLHLLQEDCRLPLEKLAVMTGSTVETVATVIDDMERSGIILRYAPVINWDKTDRERVEAMIEVRVTPQRDQGFDAIAERIYRFDEVKSVYLMSGALRPSAAGGGAYPQGAGLLCQHQAQHAGNRHGHGHAFRAQALQKRRRHL